MLDKLHRIVDMLNCYRALSYASHMHHTILSLLSLLWWLLNTTILSLRITLLVSSSAREQAAQLLFLMNRCQSITSSEETHTTTTTCITRTRTSVKQDHTGLSSRSALKPVEALPRSALKPLEAQVRGSISGHIRSSSSRNAWRAAKYYRRRTPRKHPIVISQHCYSNYSRRDHARAGLGRSSLV